LGIGGRRFSANSPTGAFSSASLEGGVDSIHGGFAGLTIVLFAIWLFIRLHVRRVPTSCWWSLLFLATALLPSSCSQFVPPPPDSHALDAITAFPDVHISKARTVEELTGTFKELTVIVARQPKHGRLSPENLPVAHFGSGVLIFADRHEYLILSSRHIVDGADWRHARHFSGTVAIAPENGDFTSAKVVGRHRTLDLVLLTVKRHRKKSGFAQPIANYAHVSSGERILVFGHPPGLFLSAFDGVVSRKGGQDLVQISVRVRAGMSGGPVYDLHGRLVGIANAGQYEQGVSGGRNLNFAVRADSLFQPQDWILNSEGRKLLNEFRAASPTRVN
jgi:S1-C subfamily serine protease